MFKHNIEKYTSSFVETFMVDEAKLHQLEYQSIDEWDSVGHMTLIALLEEKFNIEMDIDDIIDFSSYKVGMKILEKYNITFK